MAPDALKVIPCIVTGLAHEVHPSLVGNPKASKTSMRVIDIVTAAPPGGSEQVIGLIAHLLALAGLLSIAMLLTWLAKVSAGLGHPRAITIFGCAFRYPVRPINKNQTSKCFLKKAVLVINFRFMTEDLNLKIIGFDLVEVAPGDDDWDGNVGARMLYHMCGVLAKNNRMNVGEKFIFNRIEYHV